jgi:hypothetical protein
MKHRSGVEKLRIKFQLATLPRQSTEAIYAAGVIEEQTRLCVAYKFRDLVCQLAVRNVHVNTPSGCESLVTCSHEDTSPANAMSSR